MAAGNGIVYSNARVKSRESGLLGGEKITRMCHSESLREAVKILMEVNYGGGIITDNPYEYEKLLRAEEDILNEFMLEITPENSALSVFLLRNDYHNAKLMMKSRATGKPLDKELLLTGVIPHERLELGIRENANLLPPFMASALELLKRAEISGGITPRLIDTELDKAYLTDASEKVKKSKDKYLQKYVYSLIDIANFSAFMRAKKIGDESMLNDTFIGGGSISEDTLKGLFGESLDGVSEKLKYYDIGELIKLACAEMENDGSLIEFERESDNFLLNVFEGGRNDIFTVAPMAGYYLEKKSEIRAVRTILVSVKNGVDIESIRKRLRTFK